MICSIFVSVMDTCYVYTSHLSNVVSSARTIVIVFFLLTGNVLKRECLPPPLLPGKRTCPGFPLQKTIQFSGVQVCTARPVINYYYQGWPTALCQSFQMYQGLGSDHKGCMSNRPGGDWCPASLSWQPQGFYTEQRCWIPRVSAEILPFPMEKPRKDLTVM
jgi:hypothetical protein